jgi:hypothetical protein
MTIGRTVEGNINCGFVERIQEQVHRTSMVDPICKRPGGQEIGQQNTGCQCKQESNEAAGKFGRLVDGVTIFPTVGDGFVRRWSVGRVHWLLCELNRFIGVESTYTTWFSPNQGKTVRIREGR